MGIAFGVFAIFFAIGAICEDDGGRQKTAVVLCFAFLIASVAALKL